MRYLFWMELLLRRLNQDPSLKPWVLGAVCVMALGLVALLFFFRNYFVFIFKGLRRNYLRTALSSMAIMALVFVATLICTILATLKAITEDKSKDFKALVTEKFQFPSQMPFRYAYTITDEALSMPDEWKPKESDLMTWQFYGGTVEKGTRTRESMLFFFAMEPSKLRTMMDDLENLDQALVDALQNKKNGCLLGQQLLKRLNKRAGDRFTVYGMNYKDMDLEFEIVGEFPEGRYDQSAVMNRDYLNDALEKYKRDKGEPHPLAEKTLGLYWMRLPNHDAFGEMGRRLADTSKFGAPAVKFETASSGIAAFLDGYRDLIWGAQYLLTPAILAIMGLVLAVSISMSVRERRTEFAVLKVLGYGPGRILAFVLGESLLIGGGSGLLSAGLTYFLVHVLAGGIKFPIAFFPKFDIVADAVWWGFLMGSVTAFCGCIVPAVSACRIKVSEVFAKVA